jgi:SHS family lactate transporter-like MFS transporter
VADCVLLIIFELATGFCKTYGEFLAARALFGMAMGGIYGNAAATALEDCPDEARGLMSGIFQSGYPFGYLLASAFYWAFKDHTSHGWQPLFWFGAGPPVLLIIFRLFLSETNAFQSRRTFHNQQHNARVAVSEVFLAIKHYWLLLVYLSFLMTGLVYCVSTHTCTRINSESIGNADIPQTHNTQDLYPTLLQQTYGYSVTHSTLVQIVGSIRAIIGSAATGYYSQFFGRRFSMIVMCCQLVYRVPVFCSVF